MTKTITKIGNSQGIIFDAVNIEVHDGGVITLTPIEPRPSKQEVSRVIKATMKDYSRTMKKLA